jgi:pyrroline-5-carboxylate reductase
VNLRGPVWLIGCGNMGRAILKGWLEAGVDSSAIIVVDPALPQLPEGIEVRADLPAAATAPTLVLLAIKPQQLHGVAQALAALLHAETMVISILAGVEIATLRAALPAPREIVRVMPNMPASIGQGVSVAYLPAGSSAARKEIEALLTPLGAVEWIEDETQFHAVTALSGSGPAFVFRFIDALALAGTKLGLDAGQAQRLAVATVAGAAALARQSDESPTVLAAQVTSPNGTTAAGLIQLDREGMFNALVLETLAAAAQRSDELAKEAARP